MIRRSFTLLLVMLMLANQGLCLAHMPHQHDGAEPDDHDLRPHIHLGGHVHHAVEHKGHRHGDHAHAPGSNGSSKSRECLPAPPGNDPPLGDHDSDAVYGGQPVTFARTGDSLNIAVNSDSLAGLAILQFAQRVDQPQRAQSSQPPSSFFGDDGCPLYLRARTLRL